LQLDLTVTLNASQQHVVGGSLSSADVRVLNMSGFTGDPTGKRKRGGKKCGGTRNFYGDIIDDARDIPTLHAAYRNVSAKYLL